MRKLLIRIKKKVVHGYVKKKFIYNVREILNNRNS